MSKAARCELVQGATRIIIEYIRARDVLRITANPGSLVQWGPIELGFVELVRSLHVDVTPLVPEQSYLVFAGSRGLGGSRDFVGAFATEEEARQEFVVLRRGTVSWAEVVRLRNGQLRQVCWFGDPRPSSAPERRRWWRR